nr:MAG TPA: hypothetical protein [Caudoviricetes sp.]
MYLLCDVKVLLTIVTCVLVFMQNLIIEWQI